MSFVMIYIITNFFSILVHHHEKNNPDKNYSMICPEICLNLYKN